MDYTQPGFWVAIGVGGSLVASLSAYQQFTMKQPGEEFRTRAVVRDFCLGAFLTAVLYMFLPESMLSWVSAGQNLVSSTVTKLSSNTAPQTQSGGFGDIELQTGPARF
jgi:hypothetical protein